MASRVQAHDSRRIEGTAIGEKSNLQMSYRRSSVAGGMINKLRMSVERFSTCFC